MTILEYYMDLEHSKYCKAEKHEEYENIKDINEEVHNYENFRKSLLDYLNSYQNILLSDFIKKANKLYDNNKFSFTLKKYALKNLYYNWKKNSIIFTKYSVFDNDKTKNNEIFLRDYSHTTTHNKSGNSQFIHEHVLFVSNYFIRKLRESKHFYIDGTFLYPKHFSQLIVILYIDDKSGKRYPYRHFVPFGTTIDIRLSHPTKDSSPISITLSGRYTFFNFLQYPNAL